MSTLEPLPKRLPAARQSAQASPLMSPAESARVPAGLRFWSRSESTEVATEVMGALRHWSRRWDIEPRTNHHAEPGAVVVGTDIFKIASADCAIAQRRWIALSDQQDSGIWWSLQDAAPSARHGALSVRELLMKELFKESAGVVPKKARNRMADDLVGAAWSDWCKLLRERLALAGEAVGSPASASPHEGRGLHEVLRAWSGALQIELAWCGARLQLLLSADVVERLVLRSRARRVPGSSGALPGGSIAPVLRAVAEGTVSVRVELLPVEIDLGSLLTLKAGDILCTCHRLDAMLEVQMVAPNDGAPVPLCQAFLGRQGERLAVELQSLAGSSAS